MRFLLAPLREIVPETISRSKTNYRTDKPGRLVETMPAPSDTSAQGMPDWQSTLIADDFKLLAGYADAGIYFALPNASNLATLKDGSPDFFLEFFYDQNDPDPDHSLYAMVRMSLEQSGDLQATHQFLRQQHPGAALMPIAFTTGTFCHLECGDSHESAPFSWEGACRATLNTRISALTARLLYAALDTGAVTVARAAIECSFAAVLPRVECSVRFDAAKLLPGLLAALNPGSNTVPFNALVKLCDRPPTGSFQFDNTPDQGKGTLGLALAGRIRQAFGRFAPCTSIFDGPAISLQLPAGPVASYWDLRTPLLAEVPVFFRFDPFSFILNNTTRDRVTGFTRVPFFPDQLRTHRIQIVSGMPAYIPNCAAVQLTVNVEKTLSLSGLSTSQSIRLYPAPPEAASVDLKYKKIEGPKSYTFSLSVITEEDQTDSPWLDGLSDYLFLDASKLPVPTVALRATAALLEQAALSFTCSTDSTLSATLTPTQPAATFLAPALDPGARWCITAQDLSHPANVLRLELPCRSLELDLSSFPDYGTQVVRPSVTFYDDLTSAGVEFAAESPNGGSVILVFTRDQAHITFGYFATNLFASRYRFRLYTGQDDDSAAPWSTFLPPQTNALIGIHREGPGLVAILEPNSIPQEEHPK